MWVYGIVFPERSSLGRVWLQITMEYAHRISYEICLWNMSPSISSAGLIPILSLALKFPESP